LADFDLSQRQHEQGGGRRDAAGSEVTTGGAEGVTGWIVQDYDDRKNVRSWHWEDLLHLS